MLRASAAPPLETLWERVQYCLRTLGHVPAPMQPPELDLLRGTLDLLILRTLSWGPMHGLAVLRWIEQATGERLQIEEGALYPALHRMEQRGWLEAEWGYTDKNRRAKYYRLSRAGRAQLAAELSKWSRYTEAVGLLLAAEGGA